MFRGSDIHWIVKRRFFKPSISFKNVPWIQKAVEGRYLPQSVIIHCDYPYILRKMISNYISENNLLRVIAVAVVWMIMASATSPLFALDPSKTINQYGHNVWLRQNGLPANAVNVALQTHDGYLWFGTSAGLFQFDGVSFHQVHTNPENEKKDETIFTLYETKDSSLWIGTVFNGLRRLKNGKILLYNSKNGFFDTQIRTLYETRAGHFLIGTAIGVYLFDNGIFTPVMLNPNYITSIVEDPMGRIWIGTHDGIRILDSVRPKKIVRLTINDGLPNNFTTFLYTDRNANVWIGTSYGLVRWKNGTITTFTTNNGLSNNHITAVFEDRDGNIWCGTQRGLDRFTGDTWTVYTSSDGLTHDNVLSLTEDHEGSLWVCTSDGLNHFKDVNITPFTTYEGLANDYLSGINETPDGSMYFLSAVGSNIVRLKNKKFTRYNNAVGPSYVARDGSLWIGQNGMLFQLQNDRIKRYNTLNGLPAKWISAISEDRQSLILYIDHTGIFRFVDGRLKPYILKSGEQHPPSEYVVCFYQQGDSILWIGEANCLSKIQNEKITTYTTADGLTANWVSSIYDDHEGTLWISSPQGGLTRYKNGKFTAYNTRIGLFSDEIYCVLGDDRGMLWLSSSKGIGRVFCKDLDDYAEGRISSICSRLFVAADGMKADECFGDWQPAGLKSHDGRLWFPTTKGAVMIEPGAFEKNTLPPPVIIEQIVVDRQSRSSTQFVSLAAGTKSLEIHYTALSYLVPERVLFKYKLEGYDSDWIEAGTRRVAYYTNLPPGNYNFKVIACNNDGLWNEAGAYYGFRLEPYFYQTNWFYALLVLVIGGIVYGFFRLRLLQHVRKEKELQEHVKEALANIKILSGLIPICANCNKIRNDKGYWDQLEAYVQSHSDARFSHSICPECAEKLYPGLPTTKKKD